MNITLSSFGGIQPRTSAHSLGSYHATKAHNVNLRNGRLEPWQELCHYATAPELTASFHVWGCCALFWDRIVQVAEFAPDWGRLYITGRTEDPEVVTVSCKCEPTYFKLGVPAPTTPPFAEGNENCERASDARSYVYTYVNAWGEESAPSPPSNVITVVDGANVLVSNIIYPPDGYNIVSANIYRSASGFRDVDGKVQKPLTDFLYVDTITFPSNSYFDSIPMANLSLPITTTKNRMPPKGLRNITRVEGVARLAGTTKNRVHLSENFQPHNWPVKFDLTLESNIVHMKALDQKLYVTTDTNPYVIDVSNCDDTKCTPVTDVGVHIPDISCGYASSAIVTPHGLIYSSPLGVTLIDANARWHILTAKWLSEKDWRELKPTTARFGYWEGFLFVVTDMVSFLFNIDGDPYGDMKGSELSTISDKPIDMQTSTTGKLFMLEGTELAVWNMGDTYRPFYWESRELTGENDNAGKVRNPRSLLRTNADADRDYTPPMGNLWSPVSAKIRTSDTLFTLSTPNKVDAYQRKVVGEKPFRLPRIGRHSWFKVRCEGTSLVEFLDLGTAHFTVNTGE